MALVRGIMRGRSLPHKKHMIFLKISMKELEGNSVELFFMSMFVNHFIMLDIVKLIINHNNIIYLSIRI